MERRAWLDERLAATAERYDTVYGPTYDADDSDSTEIHRSFVGRVIESTPPAGSILDAPCGTGRYFSQILDEGRQVVGRDQSREMLAQARAKHSDVDLAQGTLQELSFSSDFDAAICVDSMEYVPPEDWPLVLANLRRAVRPGGLIYLTVERIDDAEVARVFAEATAEGLPVVRGENTKRGGGYHHYPTEEQVNRWLAAAGLDVVEEARTSARNYGYQHLLVRAVPAPEASAR